MPLITVYPSRFTSRGSGEGVVVSTGDVTVKSLYDIYMARTASSRSWRYRRAVLETAMRLFGEFDVWLNDQMGNPNINGFNRSFINDTVTFIEGGSRSTSVFTWRDIIDGSTDLGRSISLSQLAIVPGKRGDQGKTSKIIQRWCSRERGIEDLILTLYVLFGDRPSD